MNRRDNGPPLCLDIEILLDEGTVNLVQIIEGEACPRLENVQFVLSFSASRRVHELFTRQQGGRIEEYRIGRKTAQNVVRKASIVNHPNLKEDCYV